MFLNCDSDGCVDTDPEGAVDDCGYGCDEYYESMCGGYDDADFVSELMCCACGGGGAPGNACKHAIMFI